ncbi:MAG: mono/diheme cytochrome c family protein [Gammaproteobacteria bacterium]|jgi:mono/diheme cytochrome c family protein
MKFLTIILLGTLVVVLVVFGVVFTSMGIDETEVQVEGKWYTETQLVNGKQVFEGNCAVCHGAQGQGLAENWKQPMADGSYLAPPLNGTAHAWHHPASLLLRTINNGGVSIGGKMPAFDSKLTEKNKLAVIAYIQNWWPDNIYDAWIKRDGLDI